MSGPRVIEISGKCRIHDCDKAAQALIIHLSPSGKTYHFLECLEHAAHWKEVDDVVFIVQEEVQE